ncbi:MULTISPECIES: hypothetical protein [unclassified Streptomyces]|uniref:hypothetical protein n=1 Tax=unclassified Streptomyces TaxID=2593676 RepID=UPI002E2CE4AD|nr:hypothetical protein [Streptomyces sp. NBC_00223]
MTEPLSRRKALGTVAAAGAAALFTAGTAKAATAGMTRSATTGSTTTEAAGAAKTGTAEATRSASAQRAAVPSGVYAITRPRDQLLTLDNPDGPVIVLPPVGQPGVQEWEVRSLPNGNVTLRNLREGTFAGYEGDPYPNRPVIGRRTPTEWALRQSAVPFAFHVVVPGGPVDGVELVLDLSLLLIYPPRTALRPIEPTNQGQTWRFEYHE